MTTNDSIPDKLSVDEDLSVALCETDSNSSSEESEASAPVSPNNRKSVTFQNVEIQEYNVMLGDHPCAVIGPAITIEWDPVRSHVFTLDDYERGWDELVPRRRGLELRMPDDVRRGLLSKYHSERELLQARTEARRIQAQRSMTIATEELDSIKVVFESLGRKYKRWMRRRKGVEPEPAEVWVKQYKQAAKDGSLRRSSCTNIPEEKASPESAPYRQSTGRVHVKAI